MAISSVDGTCPRCMQPAPPGAARCPHCGDRLPGSPQRMLMVMGVVGVLVLAIVIALAFFLKPMGEELDGADQQQSQAAPPAKMPLLN